MNGNGLNLAIETSSSTGSLSLGRGDEILETRSLGPQRRHTVALLPALEAMFRQRDLKPADLEQIFVSIGPGSFTGLRVGVTTAKILGETTPARLYAVPSLPVIVQNIPRTRPFAAVFLNARRGQGFAQIFGNGSDGWEPLGPASLVTPQELADRSPGPLAVAMDAFCHELTWPDSVEKLDPTFSIPDSRFVHALGRCIAAESTPIDPLALAPLYVRLPEAEEVWLKKQKETC